MRLIWVLLICLGISSCEYCEHNSQCICTESQILCDCSGKGQSGMLVQPFSRISNPVTIQIENCATVLISTSTFNFLKITSLEFRNIGKLVFSPFALTRSSFISRLIIENIAELILPDFSLTGLDNTASVEMRNVSGRLAELSIIGRNVGSFVVENSDLVFNTLSFIMLNCTRLTIQSSFFSTVNTSLVLHGFEYVDILNTKFFSALPRSLNFFLGRGLNVTNCSFEVLPAWFFNVNVDNLVFERNHIANSETDAFIGLNVSNSAAFKNNVFENLEEDSVFPNPQNKFTFFERKVVFSRNEFDCDCSLNWMFNNSEVYSSLIESSLCTNFGNLPLLKLNSKMYSCNSMELENWVEKLYYVADKLSEETSGAKIVICRNEVYLLSILLSVAFLRHFSDPLFMLVHI